MNIVEQYGVTLYVQNSALHVSELIVRLQDYKPKRECKWVGLVVGAVESQSWISFSIVSATGNKKNMFWTYDINGTNDRTATD